MNKYLCSGWERLMPRRSSGTEKRLIEGCLQILRELDGCTAEYSPPATNESHDGLLRLFRAGEKYDYIIAVKHRPTMSNAAIILNKFKAIESTKCPKLLFADYVHEELAEYFRENKMEFVDLAGNVHINRPSMYVFVCGRKNVQMLEKTTRAFQVTGLKVIFLFLKNPVSPSWNYRQIEEATGTSLGGIAWIVRDLREMGFIRLKGKKLRQPQRELINKRALLDRWELGYAEKLRPSLFHNRYRMAGKGSLDDLINVIKNSDKTEQFLVGGELGASLLINDLRPQSATLHLVAEPLKTVTLLKLIPDPVGNIDVLKTFGTYNQFEATQIRGLTPADPLLIRAELLLRGSDRLRKIAKTIYDDFIYKRMAIDGQ